MLVLDPGKRDSSESLGSVGGERGAYVYFEGCEEGCGVPIHLLHIWSAGEAC